MPVSSQPSTPSGGHEPPRKMLRTGDWSDFVPDSERSSRRRRRRRAQAYAMLRDRKALIKISLGFYLSICVLLLLTGQLLLTAYALLPVVLTPPLGYMMYWLVWKEFHE